MCICLHKGERESYSIYVIAVTEYIRRWYNQPLFFGGGKKGRIFKPTITLYPHRVQRIAHIC